MGSNFGNIAKEGSGARLNSHDEPIETLKAVQAISTRIVAAIPEYKHEMELVNRALSNVKSE